MAANRFLFSTLFVLVITPILCAQSAASIRDVNLVIGPLDEFSRSFGLRDEDVELAARSAVKSAGWSIDESSSIMVSVSIRSGPQKNEDKYPFTLEVHGGTKEDVQDSTGIIIDDIPVVKTIEVGWDDETKILAVTKQLVKNVLILIRNDYNRQIANRHGQ